MGEGLSPWIGLPILGALLVLNGIFVAAEFALVTVRRTRITNLAEQGSKPARMILGALGNLDYYVAASQLGITMATLAIGWFGEPALAGLIEPQVEWLVGSFAPALAHTIAIAVAFLLVSALHIVVGEFAPKTIALEAPDRTALAVALPMQIFVRIFGPAVGVLNAAGMAIVRLVGVDTRPLQDDLLGTEDLAFTLESSASAGLISRRELDLARHALMLSSVHANELMVPRNEVIGIPLDATTDEVLAIFEEYRHTRYPVYEETIDNIGGVLDAKHIFFQVGEDDGDWRKYIQPVVVLPETITADQILNEAREFDSRLIVLADEYGGTAGIVSIFDIVEYLAGELPDEFETEDRQMRFNADGTITVGGLVRIADLEESLDITFPEVDAVTVGGLLTAILGHIPEIGDAVHIEHYTMRVTKMDGNRVAELRLTQDGQRINRDTQETRHER